MTTARGPCPQKPLQPVATTRTSLPRPRCSTSFSRASLSRNAPPATQPVPQQTMTSFTLPLRARMTSIAWSRFWCNCSTVSGMLGCLPVLAHDVRDVLAGQLSVNVIPHRESRGEPAAPDAAHALQGELHVGGRLVRLDGEHIAEFLHQPLAPSHVAGGPH